MRHKTLRIITLLALTGGSIMVLAAVVLPMPKNMSGVLVDHDVLEMRSAHFLRTRAFKNVFERCEELLGEGKVIFCPDINDAEGARKFMESEDGALEEEHAAAPTLLRMEDLTDRHMAVLRRMTRIGHCDKEQLNSLVEGLYDLCTAMVGMSGERGHMQKLLNRVIDPPQVTGPTWSLEEYLRAFGGKVRPDR